MSSTTGGCSPAGRAMLIGEEPLMPRMLPGRGLKRWEDTEIPMQSRAAAMREYLPAPPKWKWLRVVTAAAPCSRARPTAQLGPLPAGQVPHAAVAVEGLGRGRLPDHFDVGGGVDLAVEDHAAVPGGLPGAVADDAAQVGGDQQPGHGGGVLRAHADALEQRLHEPGACRRRARGCRFLVGRYPWTTFPRLLKQDIGECEALYLKRRLK